MTIIAKKSKGHKIIICSDRGCSTNMISGDLVCKFGAALSDKSGAANAGISNSKIGSNGKTNTGIREQREFIVDEEYRSIWLAGLSRYDTILGMSWQEECNPQTYCNTKAITINNFGKKVLGAIRNPLQGFHLSFQLVK